MLGLIICRGALLGSWVFLLLASTTCYGQNETVEVVGAVECADCTQYKIKISQAFAGLRVTIDCKSASGNFKTRGSSDLDDDGKFSASLPCDIAKDGELKEACFAQLHSASGAPCAIHNGQEASKMIFKSKSRDDGKQTFSMAEKLKFSPVTCTSAFLWPFFKHPPLPPWTSWPKLLPPFHGTPIEYPPPPESNPSPPPAPVYNTPLPPPPTPEYNLPPPAPTYETSAPTPAPVPVPELPPLPPPPIPVPVPELPPLPPPPTPEYNLPPPAPTYETSAPTPAPVPVPELPPLPPPPIPVPVPELPPPVPTYKKPIPPLVPTYTKPLPPPIPIVEKPLPPPTPIYKMPLPPPTPIFKKPLPPPIPMFKKPLPPPAYSPIPKAPPIPKLPPIPSIPRKYFNTPVSGHPSPLPP